MNSKKNLEQIKTRCTKEIKWAKLEIRDIDKQRGRRVDDKILLPLWVEAQSWLEAHEEILKIANI